MPSKKVSAWCVLKHHEIIEMSLVVCGLVSCLV